MCFDNASPYDRFTIPLAHPHHTLSQELELKYVFAGQYVKAPDLQFLLASSEGNSEERAAKERELLHGWKRQGQGQRLTWSRDVTVHVHVFGRLLLHMSTSLWTDESLIVHYIALFFRINYVSCNVIVYSNNGL